MKPYRAIPIDGKDFVYGWYTEAEDYHKEKRHFIILNNSRFYPFVVGEEKVIEPREYSINIIEVIPETIQFNVGEFWFGVELLEKMLMQSCEYKRKLSEVTEKT